MKQRILAILLSLTMMFTLVPTAMAEGETVAKVGNDEYETLAEAVANAEIGDTIVMTADTDISKTGLSIVSSKDITLDLNGYEVKAANTGAGNIKVYGKLTLKDSTDTSANGEGHGKITTVTKTYIRNQADQPIIYAVNGDFVMQSGLIDTATGITNNSADGQFGVGVQNETADASVTINGGKIKAGWYAVAGNGTLLNHDGNITVNGGILESTTDYAIYNPQKGTTTINGGVIYGQAGGISIKRGTLVVNDGTITSKGVGNTGSWGDGTGNLNNAAIQSKARYDTVTVLVKGGKVIAEGDAVTIDTDAKHPATVAVTGGTFSSDISKYCEKNYYTEQNEDNTYTVKSLKDVAVAKIGDTYYKTLVDAYAALPRGNAAIPAEPTTIEVLKDSTGGGMGSDTDNYMNYVIDFGGHTYTVGAPAVGSTGTVSQGLRVMQTSTAKFMNGTLKAANYKDLIQVVHTYGDVTFQDFTVDATEDAYAWAAVEPDAGTLKVLGNSSILAREGQYGLYAAFWHTDSYNGTTVDVDTTGKITGKLAYEFDEDYTGEKKATENKGFVNIKNGNFDILSIQEIWSDVSDAVNKNVGGIIISGGYFTSDPTAYLAEGKYVIKSDKAGYTFAVTGTKPEKTPIFVDENTTHDTSAITDETTKSAIDAVINKAKVEGVAAAVDESALVASKVDASEVDAAKKVDVEVSVKVEVKSADLSGENAAKTLTFEAKPVATIKVDGAVKATDVPVPNSLLSGAITVKLPLPADFNPEQIKHISSDGSVEYFLKTAKRGANTFEIKDGCAVFTITKFSTFEMSGTVTYVEPSYYSGSSSDPTYSVTVDKTENGSVTVSPKSASKGSTVTITVKPDSGYTLETLTAIDSKGKEIQLTDKGEGKYTFTMPAGKVEVKATFMEDNSMLNFFYDVPNGAYFYEAVKWAVKNGITTGVGNDLFAPEQPCTRAQIVTFLWRAAGSPEPKAASSFTDVPASAYYAKAVAWAVENGITNGMTETEFAPDATCTRGQSVTFLHRALKGTASGSTNFTDVASDAFYADAINWAVANNVTNGTSNTTFSPNADCTRAEIVTFLYRAYQGK